MSDKIHIDKAEVTAPSSTDGKCPNCGSDQIEQGFGLAGGGYGVYDYCEKCGTVFNKVETP